MTDIELLQQYRGGSDEAFAQLVARHLGWICGMARRRLRDSHLAEDVAQAVFMLLHQKAPTFPADGAMVSWLHRTTWYATEVAARGERRRRDRETHAAAMASQVELTDHGPQGEWEQLAPILDQLICKLSRADREALLLRYFRDMSYTEVAEQTGTTAEAARKRVDRAIEKLRKFAANQGISFPAMTLGVHLAKDLRPAPPAGLIARSVVAATSPSGAALGTTSGIIAKGVTLIMLTKTLAATAAGIAIVLGITGTIWAVRPGASAELQATPQLPSGNNAVTPGVPLVADANQWSGRNSYPRLAPFTAIRWRDGNVPQVFVRGSWYELVAVDDVPAAQIVEFTKQGGRDMWQKHFAEDLVEAMAGLGHQPGATVKLDVRKAGDAQTVTLTDVPMTAANRRAVVALPDGNASTTTFFSAVRWHDDDSPEVQVNGIDTWYALIAVDDRPVSKIVSSARQTYGDSWKQQIAEHSLDVLKAMGDHEFIAQIQLRTLDSNESVMIAKTVFEAPQQRVARPQNTAPRPVPRGDGTQGL
jgi:RNA polymerase sigma factor (sigma-70 family)